LKSKPTFALKDQLINSEKVDLLIHYLKKAKPSFGDKKFRQTILKTLPELELKERLQFITSCLHGFLPQDYPKAVQLLLEALPPQLDPNLEDDDFGEFIFWSYSLYIATFGCQKKYLNISFKALREITKRFSAEEAIRFFINQFPDESFTFLNSCVKDKNYHVRRWVSEGTRPKLPWAQKITFDLEKPLVLLDQLYFDSTRYVTRSVANHLNDISKTHPSLVIQKLQQWQSEGKQHQKEMDYLTRHALRTLTKQGHTKALSLLGFKNNPKVLLKNFTLEKKNIRLNSNLHFSFSLYSTKNEKLIINYLIENTQKKNKKVFKLKQVELNKNTELKIEKSHPFKLMTTRSLHEGEHQLSIQINGKEFHSTLFKLKL
jgi:3-methyladenine DNA glycosylase AlkC